MHRRIFMAAGAAAIGLALAAAPTGAQPVAWEDVHGPEGRYRLKMPTGYRYLRVPAHGGTLNSYVYMLPDKVTLELLDVVPAVPHPVPVGAALTTVLEQAQGGMMKSWPGSTVQEQRQIVTGPFTGREFVLAVAGARFVRTRFYITQAAVYSQVAQGPMSELGSPMVAEFFDSLIFA